MIHRNKKKLICPWNFIMKKSLTCIIVIFITSFAYTQDLTGVWRGHFWQGTLHSDGAVQQLFGGDDRYKFEVQIAQNKKTFQAVTYSYLTTIFYGKATADGTVNAGTKKVVLRELKLVEVRSVGGDACAMTCFMQYSRIGDAEFLEGTYTSMNLRDSSFCGKGTVFLKKVAFSDFHIEPFVEKREKEIAENKKPEKKSPDIKRPDRESATARPDNTVANKPAVVSKRTQIKKDSSSKKMAYSVNKPRTPVAKKPVPHNPSKNAIASETVKPIMIDSVKPERKITAPAIIPKVLLNRQNQLVKTITVNTNEIELDIYDDGTIDNDTVSVYLDKKLVISHAMLTDKPIVMKVHLDEDNDYHEVVMVADNEGTIPPNTSLMIVKAGDKRYEVRIVSTEQKNATVIFKYEK